MTVHEKNNIMLDALRKLAKLGNGEEYGNSDGNRIAIKALLDIGALKKVEKKAE